MVQVETAEYGVRGSSPTGDDLERYLSRGPWRWCTEKAKFQGLKRRSDCRGGGDVSVVLIRVV